LALIIYLATNPHATQWAAGFLAGLVAIAILAAMASSRLLRLSLLSAVAGSSLTFGLVTLSWLGLVLGLIAAAAVAGLVEAAVPRALRATEWFGIASGALVGLATIVGAFWLASG
jgi:hypothetical protein